MSAHLLEVDGPQVDDIDRQLIEPTAEAGSTDNGFRRRRSSSGETKQCRW